MSNKILKNVGLFFLLVVLCWPLTYIFGWTYGLIMIKPVGGGFMSFDPLLFGGFCLAIIFLLSFYFSFMFKLLMAICLIVVLNILFLLFFWGVWSNFLVMLVIFSVLGYFLAIFIKWLYNKLKK